MTHNPSLGLSAHFGADGRTQVRVSGPGSDQTEDSASLRLTALGYAQLHSVVGQTPERVAEPTAEGRQAHLPLEPVAARVVAQPARSARAVA